MKRYIACLAVVLAACSSPVEEQHEVVSQDAPPPATDLPSSEPYVAPCDRPTRYETVVVNGEKLSIPIFTMCDPNVSKRDLGDPPPDVVLRRVNVINSTPALR
jgi:hypothetical protein